MKIFEQRFPCIHFLALCALVQLLDAGTGALAQSAICVAPPPGLVSWWQAEGNTHDTVTGNDGAGSGTLTYGVGKVGAAFALNGTNASVSIPSSPSLRVQSFTIECWIKPAGSQVAAIVEYATNTAPAGVHVWEGIGPAEALFANIRDVGGNAHIITSAGGAILTNQWNYVAVTYDQPSGMAMLFCNGTVVASQNLGTFTPQTSYPLNIGVRVAAEVGNPSYFNGLIDEVSVYGRALTTNEIQSIYTAGSAGKCDAPVPPSIVTQPTDQSVMVGNIATFAVAAAGSIPLHYQWVSGQTNIPGATNAMLTLTNVQVGQTGTYSVIVTNNAGRAVSSNAVLNVNYPPAAVRVVGTNAPAGNFVSVPVQLVANGNEYALSCSVNFSVTALTYAGVALGSGAAAASLVTNTSQVGSGRLGLQIVMPWNTTFAPGTQEVARITFNVANVGVQTSTGVAFGDQPIARQLSDDLGNSLVATYYGGTVVVAAATAFEGDVYPRPGGDRITTLSDWVLSGRYAARLDYPTNASEFQRADCAPRSTLGDGRITVGDWVQAGRFADALDPLTPVGGPTNEISGPGAGPSASRVVTLGGGTLIQGQSGTFSVSLMVQGNENALGLSINYNPAALSFMGASLGNDAGGATLMVNSSAAASGQVGLVVALPTGSSFAPGSKEIVQLTMAALNSSAGDYLIAFADQPVPREVVDAGANALPASYLNGVVNTHPLQPELHISLLDGNALLSWPSWAATFNLQTVVGSLSSSNNWTNVITSLQTNGASITATQSISGSLQFFRLSQP